MAGRTAAAALGVLVVWLLLYPQSIAPINRTLTAAADTHETRLICPRTSTELGQHHRSEGSAAGLAVLALGLSILN